ncbi:transaldolase family protein [Salinactinospora qingdaonensis]|uniref:Transaldolase n=1 Tax=Salinactinospora qingdaonensis TaxID=702744 RepID=A0ABP7FPJ0_9ACTN
MPENIRWYDTEEGQALVRLLTAEGVSPWLQGLTREQLVRGELRRAAKAGLCGALLDAADIGTALRWGTAYRAQMEQLAAQNVSLSTALRVILVKDARLACDDLLGLYEETGGADGQVSFAISPSLAFDPDAAVMEARVVRRTVDRPNLLVALPGVGAGKTALERLLARGIGVHVTGVFSAKQHLRVLRSCAKGLRAALDSGRKPESLHVVVSMPLSPLDSAAAALVEKTAPDQEDLSGVLGIASAQMTFHTHEVELSRPEWAALTDKGALPPRLMWRHHRSQAAALSPGHYVRGVVGWRTIMAMDSDAFAAAAASEQPCGDTLLCARPQAMAALQELEEIGINLSTIIPALQREHVESGVLRREEVLGLLSDVLEEVNSTR